MRNERATNILVYCNTEDGASLFLVVGSHVSAATRETYPQRCPTPDDHSASRPFTHDGHLLRHPMRHGQLRCRGPYFRNQMPWQCGSRRHQFRFQDRTRSRSAARQIGSRVTVKRREPGGERREARGEGGYLTIFHDVDLDESRKKNGWEDTWKNAVHGGDHVARRGGPGENHRDLEGAPHGPRSRL